MRMIEGGGEGERGGGGGGGDSRIPIVLVKGVMDFIPSSSLPPSPLGRSPSWSAPPSTAASPVTTREAWTPSPCAWTPCFVARSLRLASTSLV